LIPDGILGHLLEWGFVDQTELHRALEEWRLSRKAPRIGVTQRQVIRCRYQELDLAECHAVATAVCHRAAASAHYRQTGLRRFGTDGSQTPRQSNSGPAASARQPFPQLCPARLPLTAIASAFRCPMRTTRRLPRVTPV